MGSLVSSTQLLLSRTTGDTTLLKKPKTTKIPPNKKPSPKLAYSPEEKEKNMLKIIKATLSPFFLALTAMDICWSDSNGVQNLENICRS